MHRQQHLIDPLPRYPKSISHTAPEYRAISQLMRVLDEPTYAGVARRAFRELAARHNIAWPAPASRFQTED